MRRAILTFMFGIPFFAASGASPASYVQELLGLLAIVLGILLVVVWVRIRHDQLTLSTAIANPPLEWQMTAGDVFR